MSLRHQHDEFQWKVFNYNWEHQYDISEMPFNLTFRPPIIGDEVIILSLFFFFLSPLSCSFSPLSFDLLSPKPLISFASTCLTIQTNKRIHLSSHPSVYPHIAFFIPITSSSFDGYSTLVPKLLSHTQYIAPSLSSILVPPHSINPLSAALKMTCSSKIEKSYSW